MTEEIKNAIKDSAELVRETMGFEYNADGVDGIDAFIEKLTNKYRGSDDDFKSGIVFRLGAFLGETIIMNYGGEWIESEGHYAITFGEEDDENLAYVFSKIVKRFEEDEEDTVLSFYEQIPVVFKEKLKK